MAESVKTRLEALLPTDVGWNVTAVVQLDPLVSVPVQVFAPTTNCVESPPEVATLVNVMVAPLLLL